MKKKLSLFLTIFLSSLAAAGPVEGTENLLSGLREIIIILIQFTTDTILDINSFDEFLFAKLLLFIIILIITYTAIKNNTILGGTRNKPIQWIISISVSILAIRYLPDEFIQAILLQYGALAIGITVFLPLMIYFFFLHQSGFGPTGRRLGWLIFASSFLGIWSFRYTELGAANWIYWIGISFIIISLLFDKSIHRYFGMSLIRKTEHLSRVKRRAIAQKELEELNKYREYYSDSDYKKMKEHYEKIIKNNI